MLDASDGRRPLVPHEIERTTHEPVTELERLASLGDTREAPWRDARSGTHRLHVQRRSRKKSLFWPDRRRAAYLYFLIPGKLRNVGFIPLTSNAALAARTARESRPEINNSFAAARHATVFEGVKIGGVDGEAIQKIISAPILWGDKVIGVVQISRKGRIAKRGRGFYLRRSRESSASVARRWENSCNTSQKTEFSFIPCQACRSADCLLAIEELLICARSASKCVDTARRSCYFPLRSNFLSAPTHGGTAHRHSWRSSRRKFFLPKASENIGSGFRALSWLCEMRESLRATSSAFPRSFLQTAN